MGIAKENRRASELIYRNYALEGFAKSGQRYGEIAVQCKVKIRTAYASRVSSKRAGLSMRSTTWDQRKGLPCDTCGAAMAASIAA